MLSAGGYFARAEPGQAIDGLDADRFVLAPPVRDGRVAHPQLSAAGVEALLARVREARNGRQAAQFAHRYGAAPHGLHRVLTRVESEVETLGGTVVGLRIDQPAFVVPLLFGCGNAAYRHGNEQHGAGDHLRTHPNPFIPTASASVYRRGTGWGTSHRWLTGRARAVIIRPLCRPGPGFCPVPSDRSHHVS